MTYQELLQSAEWKAKRIEILDRDKNTCMICQNDLLLHDCQIGFTQSQDNFSKSVKINYYLLTILGNDHNQFHGFIPKDNIKYFGEQIVYYKLENERAMVIAMRKKTSDDHKKIIIESMESLRQTKLPEEFILALSLKENKKNDLSEGSSNRSHAESKEWVFVNGLHIHHKYYKLGKKPWEYPNEALTTLCFLCHEKLHKESKISVFDQNDNCIDNLVPCSKCSGSGHLPEFNYYHSGICFKCNGEKYENFKILSF